MMIMKILWSIVFLVTYLMLFCGCAATKIDNDFWVEASTSVSEEQRWTNVNLYPSPDNRMLLLNAYYDGISNLHLKDPKSGKIITLIDRETYLLLNKAQISHPSWSPDGKQIAFYSNPAGKGRYALFVIPIQKGVIPRKLADNVITQDKTGPAWSPDSKYIVYVKQDDAEFDPLYIVNVLAGQKERLNTGTQLNRNPIWKKKDEIIFNALGAQGGQELYSYNPSAPSTEVLKSDLAGIFPPPNRTKLGLRLELLAGLPRKISDEQGVVKAEGIDQISLTREGQNSYLIGASLSQLTISIAPDNSPLAKMTLRHTTINFGPKPFWGVIGLGGTAGLILASDMIVSVKRTSNSWTYNYAKIKDEILVLGVTYGGNFTFFPIKLIESYLPKKSLFSHIQDISLHTGIKFDDYRAMLQRGIKYEVGVRFHIPNTPFATEVGYSGWRLDDIAGRGLQVGIGFMR